MSQGVAAGDEEREHTTSHQGLTGHGFGSPSETLREHRRGVKVRVVLDATHDERVDYIKFDRVYSDGSCALVRVGGDFVMPTAKARRGKLCCCTGTEVFEKQNGRWVFVRRVREICG